MAVFDLQNCHQGGRTRVETKATGAARGLNRAVVADLLICTWIRQLRNVLITGETGTDKTYPPLLAAMTADERHVVDPVMAEERQRQMLVYPVSEDRLVHRPPTMRPRT